jgi:hypothetical protein
MCPEMRFVMRRALIGVVSVLMLAGWTSAQNSQSESLGDLARQQRQARKHEPKEHVYTNEDLAKAKDDGGVTVTPGPATATDEKKDATPATKNQNAAKKSGAETLPPELTYRMAIKKQRAEVASLEKAVADTQHKIEVGSTSYYLDAGNRLRDPKKWTEEREKLDKELAAKQDKLQDARVKLDDLMEQARKMGVPASLLE